MPAHNLLFLKNTKGAARLNIPIRRTNRYQQYYMPSQHIYCGRVWNLIQAVMYNLAIRKCTSPEVENFQMKICYPGSNPGRAEPEADVLPYEPARRAIKIHVSTYFKSYSDIKITIKKNPFRSASINKKV